MGLKIRGRGRGRGLFVGKGCIGIRGKVQRFPGSPGMYGPPPMRFPAPPPCFGPPIFRGPSGSRGIPYGKPPRKPFIGRNSQRNESSSSEPDIDLKQVWVTEEIKVEETKKQELLQIWRNTKNDDDWKKYKEQKQIVQTLYGNAKTNYLANQTKEAVQWLRRIPPTKFYCESCDKSFRDQDTLALHKSEHEICGKDGCQYTAHPKILIKHRKLQHDSGLYRRMGELYSDEDVNKWLEERKRKYPTRKVIEEKKALEKAKMERGERISENSDKFNKDFKKRKWGRKGAKHLSRNIGKQRKGRRSKKCVKEIEMTVSDALKEENSWRGSIPPFSGIKILDESKIQDRNEDESIFSDDEWESKFHMEANSKTGENVMKFMDNSLSIIAAAYDSDSDPCEINANGREKGRELRSEAEEIDDDAPQEVKTVHIKEMGIVAYDTGNSDASRSHRSRKKWKQRKAKNFDKENFKCKKQENKKRELTLLEKLLSKEIRHERNVILQCVRYVVQNNFFLDS